MTLKQRSTLFFLTLVGIALQCTGFNVGRVKVSLVRQNKLVFKHNAESDSGQEKAMVPSTMIPNLTVTEVFSPSNVDSRSIAAFLIGQGFLLSASAVLCNIFKVPLIIPSFDPASMKTAVAVALPMIVGGLVFDSLPFEPFRTITRDTRIFTLRLLGRSSSTALAAIVALFISATTAFSEEYAFRGFLFAVLGHNFGLPAAFVGSSVLFGLAHFPQFGSSALVESLLGAIFGYAYYISGYNIAVPIAVHTLYDFATLFVTWLFASADLRRRIALAKEQLQGAVLEEVPLPDEFVIIARAVFGLLDINKDGSIDEQEFRAGMKLFSMGKVAGSDEEVKQLFLALDTNKDGRISYDEYTAMFKELVNKWVTML